MMGNNNKVKCQEYRYIPKEKNLKNNYLYQWMQALNIDSVKAFHQFSIEYKVQFWQTVIDHMNIQFKEKYTQLMDIYDPLNPKWLVNARFNIADNCLMHNKAKSAIIYAAENGEINTFSYQQLNNLVNQIANSLIDYGFKKGDRIAIDMTMTKEAVAIYLGIIKAGLSVVSIADSFAPDEIKMRMDITEAKAIFTEDFIIRNNKKIPLYDRVIQATEKPIFVIKLSQSTIKLRGQDIYFDQFISGASSEFESVKTSASDEINVLFSSGTTGEPKAIPWFHSTAIKIYSDSLLHFDTNIDDIWAWPTNLGWMMGPWVLFAALLHGATLAIYYGAPTTKKFAQFVQDARVTKLGMIPTIIKTLRSKNILDQSINWHQIKAFGSTGECSNYDDISYLSAKANNAPVIEYCGGTEIGGAYISSTMLEPMIPATFTTPAFGLDFCLLDDDNQIIKDQGEGEVALLGPSFGLSERLLNKDHYEVYYQGMPSFNGIQLRRHGDEIERIKNKDGYYYRALGRADDTMNLGGIKISSVEFERCINQLDFIEESAAICINTKHQGPGNLVIYIVLSKNMHLEDLKPKMQSSINTNLNPLFKINDIVIIDKLPRTNTNKIMRRVLRDNYLKDFKPTK